jgi:predicted enzyme related to lactoylglutathione lyase
MDYENMSAGDFGASLRGVGLNLLVRDVAREVAFLKALFGMEAFQPTDDFAIMKYADQVFQLHSDGTYHSNPLLGLLPENPPRGAGIEVRLYESDPDVVEAEAEAAGGTVLQGATDKPHGLREVYVLCENGYVWVASRAL